MIFTYWNPYWAECCKVRLQPWQKQHFSSAISCYLLASLMEVYRPFCSKMNFMPRKWPAMWRSLNQPVTVWPMHCGIFSFNRPLSLTLLCGCTVLNWSKWPTCQGEGSSCLDLWYFFWSLTLQIDSLFYLYHILSIWGQNQWARWMFCFPRKSTITIGLQRRTFQKSIFICQFSVSLDWTNSGNNRAVQHCRPRQWSVMTFNMRTVSSWWFLSA